MKFADASLAQLKAFAESKGLSFSANVSREQLIEKISKVHDGDALPDADTGAAAAGKPAAAGEFIIVKIDRGQGSEADTLVPLGVDGRFIVVPRNCWCQIPRSYLECLDLARERLFKQTQDANKLDKIEETDDFVHRYPFQVWTGHGEPPNLLKPPATSRMVTTVNKSPRAA